MNEKTEKNPLGAGREYSGGRQKRVSIGLLINDTDYKKFQDLAKNNNRSTSAHIVHLIQEALKQADK